MILNISKVEYKFILPDGTELTKEMDSNQVKTTNMSEDFTKAKSSDKKFLVEGEKAVQTILLTNSSDVEIENIVFSDALSGSAEYIMGSVTVDGVAQPTFDLIKGFSLPNIAVNDSCTITYQIVALGAVTGGVIANHATINYIVKDSTSGVVEFQEDTNTITIEPVNTTIVVVKTVDKSHAVVGDVLSYTITITNEGSQEKSQLLFIDPIPVGTSFVVGSVTIDGTVKSDYLPSTGFALNNLIVGKSTIVTFQVEIL